MTVHHDDTTALPHLTTVHPHLDTGWHDIGEAASIDATPTRVELDGEPWVAVRLGDDVLVARDRCPHRGAPLSLGHSDGNCLRCPYHGWAFDADGACTDIPALGDGATIPPRARLVTADVAERDGSIVVRTGGGAAAVGRQLRNDDPRLRRAWHPVCRSGEVAPGTTTPVELLGGMWAVERAASGALRVDGAHDIADHLGHVWIAPEAPLAPLPDIPEHGQDGWRLVPMPRYEDRYGLGLLLDNQLDAGHFSFVHRDSFGSPDRAAIAPYTVDRDGLGFEVVLRVPITARNDVTDHAAVRDAEQFRTMTYRYRAPASLFLRLDYEEMGGSTGILFCFTPLDATRCRADVDLLFQHPDGFTEQQLAERLAFEIQVVGEDMTLQAAFDFVELPLTLAAEVHTRADRAAVEMRRILTDLLDHP